MKCVLVLAFCLGAVLARPGALHNDDTKPANQVDTAVQKGSLPTGIMSAILNAAAQGQGAGADPKPTDAPSDDIPSWVKAWEKAVDMELISMGSLDNNPAVASGIDGNTYHKLSFAFGGDNHDYKIYIDHLLNAFDGNGGTLGIGYESPLPNVGDISLRAAQSFDSASNGTMDWRIDISNNAWKYT